MLGWTLALILASPEVDFSRDVQPVFKAFCYTCHVGDAAKGDLRLDRKAAALKGGASGNVILPRNASASRLVRLLEETDPDERMPRKAEPLPREKIETIRRWIDQGAVWPDSADRHWAYVKPVRPEIPRVRDASPSTPLGAGRVRNPIDAFVLARLEKEGLSPSPRRPARRSCGARVSTSSACRPRPRSSTRSSPIPAPTPMRRRSTACSPPPTTANAGRAPGWTWRGTRTRSATTSTRPGRSGSTATG